MSKGSYNGGGTILHSGSGFFHKTKEKFLSPKHFKNKDKLIAKSYYESCIEALKKGDALPAIPSNEFIQKAVLDAGGLDEWIALRKIQRTDSQKKNDKVSKKRKKIGPKK